LENESVSDIWEKMLEKKEHISVITDEYGCMRGLVTMEDVIETMLGVEIVDENDDTADLQVLAREKWQRLRKQQGIAN
jgi:CBS domain containing-hemolysin-like protein